jgi:hypothetical protein
MLKTKQALLKEYEKKEVNRYRQYDAFTDVEPGDPVVTPDKDGDCLFFTATDELMISNILRVLVPLHLDKKTAVRALKKIVSTIEDEHDFEKVSKEIKKLKEPYQAGLLRIGH